MSFNIALTGINSATGDLGVVANNIANSNTTGFKSSRAEFTDLYSSGNITSARGIVGMGTQLMAVTQQFQQGNLATTGNALDLAIDGSGFFRVSENGSPVYTRDGRFSVDRDGYIVNANGLRLTGYQADDSGVLTSVIDDLRIPAANIEPEVTTEALVGANLDADALEPALPFDYQDAASFNYTTSLVVYDSLGAAHVMELFFRRSATPNEWTMEIGVDGGDPSMVTGGANTLRFDDSGQLDTTALPQPITVDMPLTNGSATPLSVDVDLSDLTQFAGDFSAHRLSQDGFSSGSLLGVNVGDSGVLFGRYSNGQSRSFGQVALVNFQNPQGLTSVGENIWLETFDSGAPLTGVSGTGGLGTIRSGTLEDSNVVLTEELVKMISAQRNFQANAQVISTSDELTQVLLNLR